MGRKTDRPNPHGEESRRRILEATFEIANELGYEGTSIAKVSQRCGLPASSVYWHFTNKDDLFAEVIQHSFDGWLAARPRWDPPAATGQSRRDALSARLQAAVATYASSPEFWRLGLMLALEHKVVEPTARARFRRIRQDMLAILAGWWAKSLPPATVAHDPDLVHRLAQFTMAATDGLFIASQAGDEWDFPALADLLADCLDHLATMAVAEAERAEQTTQAEQTTHAEQTTPAEPDSTGRSRQERRR